MGNRKQISKLVGWLALQALSNLKIIEDLGSISFELTVVFVNK